MQKKNDAKTRRLELRETVRKTSEKVKRLPKEEELEQTKKKNGEVYRQPRNCIFEKRWKVKCQIKACKIVIKKPA